MQAILFVVVQVLKCPFITMIGEEVAVVGRTFRPFLIIIRHFTIHESEKIVIDGSQEALDGRDHSWVFFGGCRLKSGCDGASSRRNGSSWAQTNAR